MSPLWIAVIIFVVIAVGAGLVQIFAAMGDKRVSEQVTSDEDRLHTHPLDPENPSGPTGRDDEPGGHDAP